MDAASPHRRRTLARQTAGLLLTVLSPAITFVFVASGGGQQPRDGLLLGAAWLASVVSCLHSDDSDGRLATLLSFSKCLASLFLLFAMGAWAMAGPLGFADGPLLEPAASVRLATGSLLAAGLAWACTACTMVRARRM